MYQLHVSITVKDMVAFEQFEKQAAIIMGKYHGEISYAYELEPDSKNNIVEVHIVSFPDEIAFSKYKKDSELKALGSLREKAIVETKIQPIKCEKSYL